jgi:signal transduction histidine kinase
VLIGFAAMWVGYATHETSVTDEVLGHRPPILLPEPVGAVVMVAAVVVILGGTVLIVGDAGRRAFRNPGPERMALLLLLATAIIAVLVVMFAPSEWMGSVAYFGVLVAVAVGVLRYRALGIEVVVRRTLVYSILTGLVLLVFVGVVTVLARVVPSGPTPQIVAATLIAIGLAPARERVQALIDRVLYGERDDPFAALQRLGTPMGVSGDADLLRDVLAALAEALRVQSASIEGPGVDTADSVPLMFGGTELGRLKVTPRSGEAGLGKADLRLISAVAPLVAAVVHAVGLADDLRVERARVVGATQAERRRLRQELHDGLGPSLTGIGLGLEAAQKRGATDDLLVRLRTEVDASLEEVRRIIDDLRPQALDDQDLLGALRLRTEQVSSAGGVAVDLDAPTYLPDLPPSVAAAAYRIADEALTNVVRHAGATHCRVQLLVDDRLHLEVSDDGVGPGAGRDGGVGLVSMRERAERLGGRFTLLDRDPGTAVLAELPLVVS